MLTTCVNCGIVLGSEARFCPQCGRPQPARTVDGSSPQANAIKEEMSMPVLYVMIGILLLAFLFPPWESPPSEPPAFLGFHPFRKPPTATAVISRMLLIIETMTTVIGGVYASWLFRRRR
ncbi:MAG: zinc-ribbon domain-containing protein [Nitrospiraceae bacterium]